MTHGTCGPSLLVLVLTLLFLPGLVTNGRTELQPGPVRQSAAPRTDHHTQTRLLEDLTVVIVGVSHGPARQMSLSILIIRCKIRRIKTVTTLGFIKLRVMSSGGRSQ